MFDRVTPRSLWAVCLLASLFGGCDTGLSDPLIAADRDALVRVPDSARPDVSRPDLAVADAALPVDAQLPDGAQPDSALPDAAPDAAPLDAQVDADVDAADLGVDAAPDMGPACGGGQACVTVRTGPPVRRFELVPFGLLPPELGGVVGPDGPDGTYDLEGIELFTTQGFRLAPAGFAVAMTSAHGAVTFENGRWAVSAAVGLRISWRENGEDLSVQLDGRWSSNGCHDLVGSRLFTTPQPGCAPTAGPFASGMNYAFEHASQTLTLQLDVNAAGLTDDSEGDVARLRPYLQGASALLLRFQRPCELGAPCAPPEDLCEGPSVCAEGPHGGPVCQTHPDNAVQCEASQCFDTACNPATGLCEQTPRTGAPCDAGWCEVNAQCTAEGECRGARRDCADDNPCTEDRCIEEEQRCENNVLNGRACPNPDLCTVSAFCDDGECVGRPKPCPAVDACHVEGECDLETGTCSTPIKENGLPCAADGACVDGGQCHNGWCVARPEACDTAPPPECDGNLLRRYEAVGQCTPEGARCEYTSALVACLNGCAAGTCVDTCDVEPAGTPCDDANPCTHSDMCTNTGVCRGTQRVCGQDDDGCTRAYCDIESGACETGPVPDGVLCDDDNACTQVDQCRAGVCEGGEPVECVPAGVCLGAGECIPETGECSTPQLPEGAVCDDQSACTVNDECTFDGECRGQLFFDPNEPNDGRPGTILPAIDACTENLNREVWARLDNPLDIDRYRFRDELCDAFIDVEPLVEITSGSGTALHACATFECDSGPTQAMDCQRGVPGALDGGQACCTDIPPGEVGTLRFRPSCPGEGDAGAVYLQVRTQEATACGAYRVRWGDY